MAAIEPSRIILIAEVGESVGMIQKLPEWDLLGFRIVERADGRKSDDCSISSDLSQSVTGKESADGESGICLGTLLVLRRNDGEKGGVHVEQ
jgi:hypothetical protein